MLTSDSTYHIYNHANGNDNLFNSDENFYFFLNKVSIHLTPVVDLYAYCLMPNHFHFLLRTKKIEEVIYYFMTLMSTPNQTIKEIEYYQSKLKALSSIAESEDKEIQYQLHLSKQFANLFSSYTQSFNKLYNRKGSLFLKNFKSKEILSDTYFTRVVQYIHSNPVHHGFTTDLQDWKWSSYREFLSDENSFLQKDHVLSYFGDETAFILAHRQMACIGLLNELES